MLLFYIYAAAAPVRSITVLLMLILALAVRTCCCFPVLFCECHVLLKAKVQPFLLNKGR